MEETLNKKEEQNSTKKKDIVLRMLFISILVLLIIIIIILIILVVNMKGEEEKKEEEKKDEQIGPTDKIPVIGITGMRIPSKEGITIYTADQTQIHYIGAIEQSGGIPVSLPVLETFNAETIRRQVALVDGIIIQGGLDVDPRLYNEEPKPELGDIDPQTDNFLIEVIKQAKERKIPILGICRGLQILNVAYGGTLYQDLKYAGLPSESHRQSNDTYCIPLHNITVEDGTYMRNLFPNNKTMYVNSYHHQAIHALAKDFIVDARASDSIIEAIHLNSNEQWIFGTQFHPEQMMRCGSSFRPILSELIAQARKKMK